MMNDDMLRNIEYLREKADVSYEEASTLLERFDGNVMRVLVELERQGRVYQQGSQTYEPPKQAQQPRNETKERATSFINKAFQHHLVVEKKGENGKKETVLNLSAPVVAGAAIIAPHLALASAALTFVAGYRVKLKKEKSDVKVPEDVETFVDKTVSNIKETASSLGNTVRNAAKSDNNDNDEGGEITIE